MFRIDTKDKTIHVTRGDVVDFDFVATREGIPYIFEAGDIVRLNVTQKKNCARIMLSKDFHVQADAEKVEIILDENETKFGDVINAPTDYWYEFVLNPLDNPQTILGYDEDGAKIFKLYPEGKDYDNVPEEAIEVVDRELSLESDRPVANYVITGEFIKIEADVEKIAKKITGESIVPIERAAFEEMLSMGTWAPNTFYAILEEGEDHIQSNTGFYNGKYTGFSYIHKDGNVYTKTQNGTGTLRLSDVKEGQEIHVYITSGAMEMKGVAVTVSNSSEVNTYTTDENGRATVLALVDFTEISTKPYSYNIKAEYEKSVDDEFKNAYSEIHLVGADALAAQGKIDEVQKKLENQNDSFAGAYRTTLTKEYDEIGMQIDLYDIDPTEHTIKITLSNPEGGEVIAGVIFPDGNLGDYDYYPIVDGVANIPALSTSMYFRYFYPTSCSITYNKSISSAFEEVKADVEKNNTAITKIEFDTAELWERTSCRTTKSGRGSVTVDDADDTDHDILIKAVPISEEHSDEQGLFAITISVPATGEEYQIGSPEVGEVIKNPRSPFTAEIRGPQQAYFSVEVTYNTSVSKGFEDFKAETDKAIGNIDTALDEIIVIQNELIGGDSV